MRNTSSNGCGAVFFHKTQPEEGILFAGTAGKQYMVKAKQMIVIFEDKKVLKNQNLISMRLDLDEQKFYYVMTTDYF